MSPENDQHMPWACLEIRHCNVLSLACDAVPFVCRLNMLFIDCNVVPFACRCNMLSIYCDAVPFTCRCNMQSIDCDAVLFACRCNMPCGVLVPLDCNTMGSVAETCPLYILLCVYMSLLVSARFLSADTLAPFNTICGINCTCLYFT